jgi:hypothetical protein
MKTEFVPAARQQNSLGRTKQVIESGCDGTTIDHPDYRTNQS